jgi:hypothetical protein
MTLRQSIEQALAPLRNLPMWAAGSAGGILWLQFGDRQLTVDYRGQPKEVGAIALHISCAWRWLEAWGSERADHHADHQELNHLGQTLPVVDHIMVGERGLFSLGFLDGSRLVVEPDLGEPSEEWWRIFNPGDTSAHFVVGSDGIEPLD